MYFEVELVEYWILLMSSTKVEILSYFIEYALNKRVSSANRNRRCWSCTRSLVGPVISTAFLPNVRDPFTDGFRLLTYRLSQRSPPQVKS